MLQITNSKNSKFQGQQKKVMGTKHVRKTKSYVRNCILKNRQFFYEYLEIKAETKKNAQSKQCFRMGVLSHLKIFTLKMGTLCIYRLDDYLFLGKRREEL